MKKLLPLLLLATSAFGQSAYYQNNAFTATFLSGTHVVTVIDGSSVEICTTVTGVCTKVPIFADQALTVPITNPVPIDSGGNFGFWVAPGSYSYWVLDQVGTPLIQQPFTTGGGSGSGGGMTQLTGDVTAAGSGSVATTLATVNSAPGSCGDATHVCQVTTNGKGLTTAQTAVAITPSSSGVASLNTIAGAVNLVAGANIAITPSGSNITIASTAPSTLSGQSANYLPKANTGTSSIGPSIISDDGTTATVHGGLAASNVTDAALSPGNCVQAAAGGLLGTSGTPCGAGTTQPSVVPSKAGSGTTYYVSSSTGSDLNAGTSAALPWKTISKVNGLTLVPGDRVLFYSGDVWHEQLTPPSSGSSSAQITFGWYGPCAPVVIGNGAVLNGCASRPVIDGSDTVSGWTVNGTYSTVYQAPYTSTAVKGFVDGFAGNSYQETPPLVLQTSIANVSANGGIFSDGTNVYVKLPDGSSPVNHVVEVTGSRAYGIELADKSYITVNGLEVVRTNQSGIHSKSVTDNSGGSMTAQYNVIQNSAIFDYGNLSANWYGDSGEAGVFATNLISTGSQTAIPGWVVQNTYVGEGTIPAATYSSGNVALLGMASPSVYSNKLSGSGAFGVSISPQYGEAAGIGGSITNNDITGFLGGGIRFVGVPNGTIAYNKIHDANGSGILIGSNGQASPASSGSNETIAFNDIYNLGVGAGFYNGIDCNGNAYGAVISGNRIRNVAHSDLTLELDPAYSGGPAGCYNATISGNVLDASTNTAVGGIASPLYVSSNSISGTIFVKNTLIANAALPNSPYGFTTAGNATTYWYPNAVLQQYPAFNVVENTAGNAATATALAATTAPVLSGCTGGSLTATSTNNTFHITGLTGTACVATFSAALRGVCTANAYNGTTAATVSVIPTTTTVSFGITAGTTDITAICF